MKKFINIICAITAAAALSSCEDFLNREPNNELPEGKYFSSTSDLQMYTDGMLNAWMPNPADGTLGGDAYNDLIATKTSTDFFRADVEWNDVKQGGWSWTFLRRCNYMLNNMDRVKKYENISKAVLNHYRATARFWRGYYMFERIKTFSNVVYTDKVLEPTDYDALHGERIDREEAFELVKQDLVYAADSLSKDKAFHSDYRNRIDWYIGNAIASRIFLYEASFRSNVKNNPATGEPWTNKYDTPKSLYELAAKCAKNVIDSKEFKLTKNYIDLFQSKETVKEEVLWSRSYILDVNGRHGYSIYFNSSTNGQQYSGTKDLVMMFLKKDGKPVTTGEMTIAEEFKDRDPRLNATVLGPGRQVKDGDKMVNQDPDFSFCMTGYQLIKWVYPDVTHFNNSFDETSIPLLRYPEVLLNYAEAMNELGKMTKTIWDETVGAIRTRAGVTNIYPGDADYVKDEWLAAYYRDNLTYKPALNDVALEIRRERVTELTFEEQLRQNDVYRYGQADLIARRSNLTNNTGWVGIWVSKDQYNNGFTFNDKGNKYQIGTTVDKGKTSAKAYLVSNNGKNGTWSTLPAGDGYYLVYTYKLKWEDRMYCRPVPQTSTLLNPNLLPQNKGWE